MKFSALANYLNGSSASFDGDTLDVTSPLDGSTLTNVPLSGSTELQQAIEFGEAAFEEWSKQTVKQRVQVLFRYRSLLEENKEELAELVHWENGKTVGEGRAEVDKAIEVTEFACSLPQLTTGEVLEVSPGVECRIDRVPLGVVASITPFNFPCMVPHWTIPIAIGLGNSLILKPSEKVPLTAVRSAELMSEAGLPNGVFQILHGDRQIVEAICDEPRIQALTFVGSTPIAKSVYGRAAASGKRILALGGAKNHLVVLPDAEPAQTAENVAASMAGCAGQRCMAASALVAVGDCDTIIDQICSEASKYVPGETLGAVITHESKERIERYINEAEEQGAKVLLDGRQPVVPGCENGSYVGPTVLDGVSPDMAIAQDEIFGPVLAVIRAKDIDEAIDIENRSQFGNAAAVYTENGSSAKNVVENASAGMIGVNIGVPVPREPFGFGGWNDSRFGVGDITGKASIDLWTQSRKVTTRWNA